MTLETLQKRYRSAVRTAGNWKIFLGDDHPKTKQAIRAAQNLAAKIKDIEKTVGRNTTDPRKYRNTAKEKTELKELLEKTELNDSPDA